MGLITDLSGRRSLATGTRSSSDRFGGRLFDADGIDHGGSANMLTSWHPTPYAKGNAQMTTLVQASKAPRA